MATMSAENGSANEPHPAGDETADDATPAALATATESNSSYPRAKINISLGGKKKKKKTSNNKNNLLSSADGKSLLAEEYSTIAEEAEIISQKRKEEGTVLVIPCAQGANDEEKRKHPLLAGRLALLQKGDGAAIAAADDDEKDERQLQNNADDNNDATNTNSASNDTLEDEVVKQLISESKKDKDNADSTTASGRGLVIAAPSQNKLITGTDQTKEHTTTINTANIVNEDEQFQQELSHHANDVDPTSSVYTNVAISDFGSALLRGMGWTGGDNNKSGGGGKKNEETIKARPHRLGLGATPLPLPSATTSNSSRGGIHRRARRPDEVKRDEERQKQQEEAERIAAEKKQLDVQVTLQPGSVVHVRDENKRAKVVKTAGVPGLNRILIQFEGSDKDVSVAKNSVKLCSWEELDVRPFQEAKVSKSNEREQSPRNESSLSRRKRSRSYDSADDEQIYRKEDSSKRQSSTLSSTVHEEQYHDRDDVSDDDSRDRKRRSKKHKRKKHHRHERSYSRSRSRSRSPDYKKRRKHESHRSSSYKSRSSDSQKQQPQQHHFNWLIPNIRVRIVSKKIPAYYLQKGVVQDVTRSSQSSNKAVLLMDNGQVIDKVPERYLETALPKAGGNIIVLEGNSHHWKKGKLLERSSEGGYGVIQFAEDLEVVTVSLDSIAEYCNDCDE